MIQELSDPQEVNPKKIHALKKENNFFISTGRDFTKIWNAEKRVLLYEGDILAYAFDHDTLYVSPLRTGEIEARSKETGIVQFQLPSLKGEKIFKITISGTRLLACKRTSVELWNLRTRSLIRTFDGDDCAFFDDDRIVASAEEKVKIWDFSLSEPQ